MSETTITVEPGGLVVRGLAIPFNEETVVVSPAPRGGQIVHREKFDETSIANVGAMYGKPIPIGHDDRFPVGRIRLSRSTARGAEIEAELVGGDEEIEAIRRKVGAGLHAGLSIGFYADRAADQWLPAARGELPLVVRRGVQIRETSLVQWPAYLNAGISGIHVRTADGERRHASSIVAIATTKTAIAEAREALARRR